MRGIIYSKWVLCVCVSTAIVGVFVCVSRSLLRISIAPHTNRIASRALRRRYCGATPPNAADMTEE